MPALTRLIVLGLCGIFILPVLAFANMSGSNPGCTTTPSASLATPGSPATAATPSSRKTETTTSWDSEQITNATAIIQTGAHLGVPVHGWVIALTVAIQESSLHNLNHGDTAGPDSRGLFQQRNPWGPPATRMNPTDAATLFYQGGEHGQKGLLDIPHWQSLPLSDAAQAVQHSAHRRAYADHEQDATTLVATIAPGALETSTLGCPTVGGDIFPRGTQESIPAHLVHDPRRPGAGFALPAGAPTTVTIAVTWALAQLGTPYSYGGDCTAAHSGNPAHECDCSSLIQQAYRASGIALPRTAAEQVKAGTAVASLNELQPGDLVFIPGAKGTSTAPGHVGMFIGDGLLVHSPETGRNVQLAELARWTTMITAIRRPVS